MKRIKSFPLALLSGILTIIASIVVQMFDVMIGSAVLAVAWLTVWLPLVWGIVEVK